MRHALAGAAVFLLAAFVYWFQPAVSRWWADALWLAAIAAWVVHGRVTSGTTLLPGRVTRPDVVPIAALVVVFAAGWLPFYNNWRWAYSGDSIAWFGVGASVVGNPRLPRDLLSVHGVDDNFTYLHSLTPNALLFVFGPTLFWHRVGKLVESCAALVAIYAFFTLALGRPWGIAIAVGVATHAVWIWFSYVSYGHIDSHITAYVILSLTLLIWREPERRGLWLVAGLVAGWSLFFTQTAWAEVSATGLALVALAVRRRRWAALATYAASFAIAALPVALQWQDLLVMANRQTRVQPDWTYLRRIFTDLLNLPVHSPYRDLAAQLAFMRPPLSWLYVGGGVLGVLGAAPPLRRVLRIPAVAAPLAALLLWDAVLMTFTNNQYSGPSVKRSYHLIPLQVFFAVLPLVVVQRLAVRWAWLGRAAGAGAAACVAVSAVWHLWILVDPIPRVYGFNVWDGLVEVRQRFADRRAVLFSSRERFAETFGDPESFFNRFYELRDTIRIEDRFTPEAMQAAYDAGEIICYETNFGAEQFFQLLKPLEGDGRVQKLPLLNADEMYCFDRPPRPSG
jgi:hypothetical protein